MTTRDYLVRLAVVFGVFFVLVPGALILFALTPYAKANPVVGMPIYFIGVPLWVVALSLAFCRAVAPRMTTVNLPGALSLCVIPLVLGDGYGFMGFFQGSGFPYFFAGAVVFAVALLFWPEKPGPGDDRARTSRRVAIAASLLHAGLGALAVAGLVFALVTTSSVGLRLQLGVHRFAFWTFAVLVLSQMWAILETRRAAAPR